MTITFEEKGSKTAWTLTTEENRLLETLRLRLLEHNPPQASPSRPPRDPLPRFETVADLIQTHIVDSLLLDQIKLETEQTFRAAATAEVAAKHAALTKSRIQA